MRHQEQDGDGEGLVGSVGLLETVGDTDHGWNLRDVGFERHETVSHTDRAASRVAETGHGRR